MPNSGFNAYRGGKRTKAAQAAHRRAELRRLLDHLERREAERQGGDHPPAKPGRAAAADIQKGAPRR